MAADDVAGLQEGSAVHVEGELLAVQPAVLPAEVAAVLEASTYRIVWDDVDAIVLLTGMEPGHDQHTVSADAVVIHQSTHDGQDYVVLAIEDADILG